MSDEYDLALVKLAKWEKGSKRAEEASISVSDMMKAGRSFFIKDDYESESAKIERMTKRSQHNAGVLAGEAVQGAEAQQAGGRGRLGEAEEEVMRLVSEIEGAVKRQPKGEGEARQEEKPHLSLGRMLGGLEKEMAKSVEKQAPEEKGRQLAGLSVQDQVSALEMLIRELRGKEIQESGLPGVRDEMQALYSETKTEKQPDNEFQRNLTALRNARLGEAMGLLGMNA